MEFYVEVYSQGAVLDNTPFILTETSETKKRRTISSENKDEVKNDLKDEYR